jgi:hypothetical protein
VLSLRDIKTLRGMKTMSALYQNPYNLHHLRAKNNLRAKKPIA